MKTGYKSGDKQVELIRQEGKKLSDFVSDPLNRHLRYNIPCSTNPWIKKKSQVAEAFELRFGKEDSDAKLAIDDE